MSYAIPEDLTIPDWLRVRSRRAWVAPMLPTALAPLPLTDEERERIAQRRYHEGLKRALDEQRWAELRAKNAATDKGEIRLRRRLRKLRNHAPDWQRARDKRAKRR